jgi:hypothetical protein
MDETTTVGARFDGVLLAQRRSKYWAWLNPLHLPLESAKIRFESLFFNNVYFNHLPTRNLGSNRSKMQVIINSDNQIDFNQPSIEHWQNEIAASLQRFSDWVTRVEVHLTDENSDSKKGSDDIRCLMEARPANRQPVSIEIRAASVEEALSEGAKTMKRRLGAIVDKERTEERKRQ